MFERLQKPFLTVETGEAYQPIRISYLVVNANVLIDALNQMKCLERKQGQESWHWFWRDECETLHFESLNSFKKHPTNPLRLGTLTIRDDSLFLNLPSFKRACMAISFFHPFVAASTHIHRADFINKVFGLSERLPHGFAELFKEDELETLVSQRLHDYEIIQMKCEQAATAEEALSILAEYTHSEASKKLPFAERYAFQNIKDDQADPEIVFLGFYIFLRGRELVAIRRWYGDAGYTLANAADETIEKVFGGMQHIDIIE